MIVMFFIIKVVDRIADRNNHRPLVPPPLSHTASRIQDLEDWHRAHPLPGCEPWPPRDGDGVMIRENWAATDGIEFRTFDGHVIDMSDPDGKKSAPMKEEE